MFNEKTVLILGAGASVDYGFPTGSDLIKDILGNRKDILNEISEILVGDIDIPNDFNDNNWYKKRLDDLIKDFIRKYNFFTDFKHLSLILDYEELKNLNNLGFNDFEKIYGRDGLGNYFFSRRDYSIRKYEINDYVMQLERLENNNDILTKQIAEYRNSTPKFIEINDNILEKFFKDNSRIESNKEQKDFCLKVFKNSAKKYFKAVKFFQILDEFDPISIDFFLSIHKDEFSLELADKKIVNIGKFAISHIILKYYNQNKIKNNWYRYILDQILRGCQGEGDNRKKIKENKLNIITFNYDASLDNFLYERLSNLSYFDYDEDGETKNYAKEYLEDFLNDENPNIYHIYGKISHKNHEKADIHQILNESNNIKVIDEDRKIDKIDKIRDLLVEAKKVYIIGYGFDDTNNGLLELNKLFSSNFVNNPNHVFALHNEITILNYENSQIINKKIHKFIFENIKPSSEFNKEKFKILDFNKISNLNIVHKPIAKAINVDFNFS